MALEVEDGTGKSNADSYLSQADADTIHDARGSATEWDAVSDKDVALRLATEYLDNRYRGRWKGTRINETMSLAWPRYDVEDYDGFYLSSSAVPSTLKKACAILALKTASETLLADVSQEDLGVKSESVKIGSLSISTDRFGYSSGPYYPEIEALLQDLVDSGNGVIRG